MDLAGGGTGEERYANNTGRSHIQIHAGHFHKVPGNFDPTVPTPFLSDWEETSEFTREISGRRLVVNLNDRGAQLEGTTVVHPKDIEEVRRAISENLTSFKSSKEDLLSKKRDVQGKGMTQILMHLANRCDQAWKSFPCKETSRQERIDYLNTLFANRDMASLLGDFAFTILPKITSQMQIDDDSLKGVLAQLEKLIWRLEDGILECNPEEDFLIRFLTEKFN